MTLAVTVTQAKFRKRYELQRVSNLIKHCLSEKFISFSEPLVGKTTLRDVYVLMPAVHSFLFTTKQHAMIMIFNVSEIVALPESMGLLPSPVIVSVPGIRYFILDKKTRRPLDRRQKCRQCRNVAQAAATRNSTEEA